MEAVGFADLSWYEVVHNEAPLEQGDILRNCPVPVIASELPVTEEAARAATIEFDFDIIDIIILSQSCDIAMQAGKPRRVEDMVVCPAWELQTLREDYPEIDRGSFISDIVKGRVPLWHALAVTQRGSGAGAVSHVSRVSPRDRTSRGTA